MTTEPSDGYRGASAHYLSPHRRDAVKRHWEEPVNHRLVALALDRLPVRSEPLVVVDVGAGTGDGVVLLESSLALTTAPSRAFRYVGVDPDPEMIATARAIHRDREDVTFVSGDVREEPAVADVDLYLSSGVPYSHLSHEEFDDALVSIFSAAARRPVPTAVVIDVLGRYSLEWTPRWPHDRWTYAMSFFQDTDPDAALTASMSFHSRWSLDRAISRARDRAGPALAVVEYHDRSVMVGRHTTTGAFNPDVPNYRDMLNRLYDGDTSLDLRDLELTVPGQDAPPEVRAFFTTFASSWNARVARAGEIEGLTGRTAAGRVRLGAGLCALEHGAQQGLGVGHSLLGLVVTDP